MKKIFKNFVFFTLVLICVSPILSGCVFSNAENIYEITVQSSDPNNGSTYGAGRYTEGETITIVAEAKEGYEFSKWVDGDTNPIRQVVVNGNQSYTANFTSKTKILRFKYAEVTTIITNIYNSNYLGQDVEYPIFSELKLSDFSIQDNSSKSPYYRRYLVGTDNLAEERIGSTWCDITNDGYYHKWRDFCPHFNYLYQDGEHLDLSIMLKIEVIGAEGQPYSIDYIDANISKSITASTSYDDKSYYEVTCNSYQKDQGKPYYIQSRIRLYFDKAE